MKGMVMYFLIMWIKIIYLHAEMLISLVECGTLFALWNNIDIIILIQYRTAESVCEQS